ncbi:CPBP family intramembrane glutamic endopeptidase [Desulfitobacterium sp.]|uniref:CPBP family intramembrane glutamic endopeptidase n=1 Tax=Desulfitobacterium sp. TaxID=49981 RepID=UPI002B1EF2C3|nr:CPBP family intramembrane glutamic endopeptidase [Desulfitobacterium sp.]MEA4901968.1 CPBP family intramembrane glutamic endopeptidase [Desulfitobacterium sp.]
MKNEKNKIKVPPKNPRWNIWQGLFLLLIILLIELLLGWLKTPQNLDHMQGFLHFLTVGIGEVILYLSLLWIFMKLIHGSFRDLGFVRPKLKYIILGLLMGVFLFFAVGLLGNFLANLLGNPAPQSFTLAVTGSNYSWQVLLLIFLGGVLAPIKEEAFFRGLIYPPLRHAFGKGKGILLCAGFFAVLHSDIIRFIPLLIGGIVLTWLYEKSSSLWTSIIAHGTWNILMALALWVQC